MLKELLYMAYVLPLVLLVGCGTLREQERPTNGLVVINVLDKALYDDCHIPGSVHVSFNDVEKYVSDMSKDTEIVLYCSNYACSTSAYVAKKLKALGFSHVYVYKGGTAEWKQFGLPVVGKAESPYLVRKAPKPSTESTSVTVLTMHELAEKMHIDISDTTRTVAA